MNAAGLETVEHISVALAALLGSASTAYISYKASQRHTNGRAAALDDRVTDLEDTRDTRELDDDDVVGAVMRFS